MFLHDSSKFSRGSIACLQVMYGLNTHLHLSETRRALVNFSLQVIAQSRSSTSRLTLYQRYVSEPGLQYYVLS